MDPIQWPVLVPSGGVLIVLVWLIIHLVRQASGDRGDYQEQLRALREQHASEIQGLTSRHDSQMKDLRDQITTLRSEVKELRGQIEQERRARWEAEDAAAKWRRKVEEQYGTADDS